MSYTKPWSSCIAGGQQNSSAQGCKCLEHRHRRREATSHLGNSNEAEESEIGKDSLEPCCETMAHIRSRVSFENFIKYPNCVNPQRHMGPQMPC